MSYEHVHHFVHLFKEVEFFLISLKQVVYPWISHIVLLQTFLKADILLKTQCYFSDDGKKKEGDFQNGELLSKHRCLL